MPKTGSNPKKVPKSVKYVGFFIMILLALFAALGIGVAYAYRDTFYPGLAVAGVSVSGLTQQEAITKVNAFVEAAETRKVVVAVPDITQPRVESTGQYPETEISTTARELGLEVASEASLNEAWKIGHKKASLALIKDIAQSFLGADRNYSVVPAINSDQVRTFVDTKVAPKAVAAQPAKIVIEGKEVKVQDGTPGLTIDANDLATKITTAATVSLDSGTLSFRLPASLVDSEIGRSRIQPLADELSQLADTKVALVATDLKLVPNREELLQWYVPALNEAGEVSLGINSSRISTYLQKTKTLDQQKSLASVTKAATDWLATPKTSAEVAVTVKPPAVVTAGNFESGLFEGKYVYVNLAEQKVYQVIGTTMVKVFKVSTGKWATPTPRGTFAISGKHPRAYSKTYGLYMPYWQNFLGTSTTGEVLNAGEYGLHELPEWPNGYKEGQGHLGTAVSHGCVRFGVGDAKEMYEWTEIGTPVVIR